jgi:hypothetical protein
MTHDRKETIRTTAAVLAVLLSSIAVLIQSCGLWFIMHHQH